MKFIKLIFVVKSEYQTELINVDHISRVLNVSGSWYVGLQGQGHTKLLSRVSERVLLDFIQANKID